MRGMLRGTGTLFLLAGLLLGGELILGPLGHGSMPGGASAIVLFSVLTGCGTLLLAVASRLAAFPILSRLLGSALLLLAAGSAVGLVLLLSGERGSSGDALQAGTVLFVSGALGGVCLRRDGSGEAP